MWMDPLEVLRYIEGMLKYPLKIMKWMFKGTIAVFDFFIKNQNPQKGTRKKKTGTGKIIGKAFLRYYLGNIVFSIIFGIIKQIFANYVSVVNTTTFISNILSLLWLIFNIMQAREDLKRNKLKIDITIPPDLISDIPRGILFGKILQKKKKSVYITKPESLDGHVIVVGGVGSGKSSCIAIPTLRAWSESVFAIDIKGELYEKTKDNRQNIKVFNPLDEKSYGYDPYFCLHSSDNPAQEARAIAQAIIPLPIDTREPFWIESAQGIFTAAILHYSAQNLSFLDTIRQIQSTTPKSLITLFCSSPVLEARYCVSSLADMEDRTLSSIMAELSKNIVSFVTDKNLSSALSRARNITPDDLEAGNDVYINIPEHLLRQWKNLLTLIVNQFLTHFEQRPEENAKPILFLLDEFPRLGKVNAILDGLATLRSKKISICLIIQSLAQLDAIYGHNERKVISDTCAYKAILGATDADTQEYFSRLSGTYDKEVTTKNKEAYTGLDKGTSISEQERRIIKPHEFGMLTDIVLFIPPLGASSESLFPFCRVDKAPYYTGE